MTRLRLTLEYHGAGFSGWQRQPERRTVQGALEAACERLAGRPVRVHAAGRTDAGVHAEGQVAHLDWPDVRRPRSLGEALDAHLPDDLSVVQAIPVRPDFDARRDARSKRYRYRILARRAPSPLRSGVSWHVRGTLDPEAMRRSAECLVGDRDFAAFRGAPGGPPPHQSTRRTLDVLRVEVSGDELRVVAEARSFLRHMVRNLVGTLVEAGAGRVSPLEVARILESGDRARAGPTAPACGLCLVWVKYPDDGET
ncbi:MAG: tRNA pseudouridine(38-40) synthase TruA [Myxococcota bacterium]